MQDTEYKKMTIIHAYIRKIRNSEKKRFAIDYLANQTEGKTYNLSIMGRQAVWMTIDRMLED